MSAPAEAMAPRSLPPLIIVSGMSGSGKSVALNTFEDLGYYCVDNLPAELLPEFVRRILANENAPEKIAVGIDARSLGDLADVPEALSQIGAQGLDTRLLFFDTRNEVLLRRSALTTYVVLDGPHLLLQARAAESARAIEAWMQRAIDAQP